MKGKAGEKGDGRTRGAKAVADDAKVQNAKTGKKNAEADKCDGKYHNGEGKCQYHREESKCVYHGRNEELKFRPDKREQCKEADDFEP